MNKIYRGVELIKVKVYAILIVCIGPFVEPISIVAAGSDNTYYACTQGYKFESKSKAARCVKEKRTSHRPPLSCSNDNQLVLTVDHMGKKDICTIRKSGIGNSSNKLKLSSPKCPSNYTILARKGKDSCVREYPQSIIAPRKKIRISGAN